MTSDEPKKATKPTAAQVRAAENEALRQEAISLHTDVSRLAAQVSSLAAVTKDSVTQEVHDRYRRRIGFEIAGLVIVLVAAIIGLFAYTSHVNKDADNHINRVVASLQGSCQQRNDQNVRAFQTTVALKSYLLVIDDLIKQPGAIPPGPGVQHDLAVKQIAALHNLEESLPVTPAISDCSKFK